MAGIGFQLKRLLGKDTLLGTLRGYLFAAAISSGPWLFSVFSLSLLALYSRFTLGLDEHALLFTAILYSYAFTLVTTGAFQMVVSRVIADRLYLQDFQGILPVFNSTAATVCLFNFIVAVSFYWRSNLDRLFCLIGVVLFVTTGLIWISMMFLSAAKDYLALIYSFGAGTVISFLAGHWMGQKWGLNGYFAGFTLGQTLLLFALVARVRIEFYSDFDFDTGLFHGFRKFWDLALIGFFYNLGIWIDNMVFWFSSPGKHVSLIFYTYPFYDSSTFIAFLSIVPTLSLFLIRIETGFYSHYRDYYGDILHKRPLSEIEGRKDHMIASLGLSLRRLLRLQGGVTLICLVACPWIIPILGFQTAQLPMLRISLVSAFLLVTLMVQLIVLLYFDFRKVVLGLTSLFCVTNGVFTWFTVKLGFAWHGTGLAASCLLTLMAGYIALDRRLNELEYRTFMSQPIESPKLGKLRRGADV